MNTYFNKITSTINPKYKINDTMTNKGLIGIIFGTILHYPFGPFYHEMYFTHYYEKTNSVTLSLMRFGVWGHSYMGSINYEIYDDTHYIFKECKKKFDTEKQNEENIREHYKKTCKQSPFCSLAFNN